MADAETKNEQDEPIEVPSLDFLKHCVFNYGKSFEAYKDEKPTEHDQDISMAADAAYLDMCRTLSNKEESDKGDENMREEGIKALREAIKEDLTCNKDFDDWHDDTCEALMAVYNDSPDSKYKLFYGQAQKWLNMTMKYLLVLGYDFTPEQISKFHAPIDERIIERANLKDFDKWKEECDNHPEWVLESKYKPKWSRMDKSAYDTCREAIEAKAKEENFECPILWEFKAWNDEDDKDDKS